ncbi:unnamed protein product [Nesidiocoris tenuis]|uniref:Uncharacterized protein n=1 Tax=Nesidiocoris tenuis TaxID=355587 RepID=A0A6H5GW91_9HEMI|nr:unnamed protein product [Nesidiocoris tenuis]
MVMYCCYCLNSAHRDVQRKYRMRSGTLEFQPPLQKFKSIKVEQALSCSGSTLIPDPEPLNLIKICT